MVKKVLFSVLMVTFVLMSGCDKEKAKISAETKKKDNIIDSKAKEAAVGAKTVKLETSMGDIVIELNGKQSPVTAANFLRYVEEKYYDGLIFHRVIKNFMIQGGGFTADMQEKKPNAPIVNEAKNGLKNDRGTIAMARTNDPDSATCQFFINHKNNDFLNYIEGRNPGYAVFGKVVEGMDVVDKIAAVKTTSKRGFDDVPAEPVVIKSVRVVDSK